VSQNPRELPPAIGGEAKPGELLTSELVQRAQAGDAAAMERILERYLPRLQRWASGRLPAYARSLFDTADLVQETLLRAVQGIERIQAQPGAFQGYVRKAILNRIRDQIRWAARRRGSGEISESLPDPAPSPTEEAVGAELLARYERGMEAVDEEDRRLLHLRIDMDFDFDEIAAMTGRPSPNAARMAFQRALRHLAEAMGREG
jgi:RNA polymerase sigma-70 factor (ECF subfamily)